MATHSSIVAWKIPWTDEPDRLQSMGSQRVGHDIVLVQETQVLLEQPQVALQGVFVEGQVQPGPACK